MIPTFRAKHYRDDVYFIGSLIGKDDEYYIVQDEDMEDYRRIDTTTLAIHFKDMLDSQRNKIFASLSEDGKGGDILFCSGFGENTVIYANCGIRFLGYENHKEVADFQFEKIIGVQE